MSYAPKNIRDMVTQNTIVADGKAFAMAGVKDAAVNKWHEKDTVRQEKLYATGAPLKFASVGLLTTTQAMRDGGIRSGVEQIKLSRQARMVELYQREALQYEAELSGLGLSLAKPRD